MNDYKKTMIASLDEKAVTTRQDAGKDIAELNYDERRALRVRTGVKAGNETTNHNERQLGRVAGHRVAGSR